MLNLKVKWDITVKKRRLQRYRSEKVSGLMQSLSQQTTIGEEVLMQVKYDYMEWAHF